MIYECLIKRLNPLIEEEATIEINGVELTGFISICPYEIKVGKSYQVAIGFTILDELIIHEILEEKKEIERIGSGYDYYLSGLLHAGKIDAGLVFTDDDEYFADFLKLKDKPVEIKVDRISLEFISTK
ncbi:hypothetical protein K3L72_16695 [Bacillus altitudinis]|uniref:Uncharacterized protein n=1 Tax=Bacillus altitudinis TaxID=293387 RepID=A0ABV1S052_BACAB|nr:hypothetical protein [Bacillus altitudinis]MBY0185053.1 hypothetical protein [Bacillus aerophilus]MCW4359416.1 hypothetical protein [Bacillus altitudinis]NOL34470.1 hypothetical protein [Bacillus altitudinis]WQH38657.1 hypothetical protein U2873_17950 [Bacillus altitudinis]